MTSASILTPIDYPLDPSADPSTDWQAESVIVCTVSLAPTPNSALIHWPPTFDRGDSWIYQIAEADRATFSIADYAKQVCLGETGNTGIPVNWGDNQYVEFAISGPCYVMLILDPFFSWQFQCAIQGIKLALDPSGKYSKLMHVKAGGDSVPPAASIDDGCKIAYFEADTPIVASPAYTRDRFNIYAEFVLGGGSYLRKKYDPDIKNTGRPKFIP